MNQVQKKEEAGALSTNLFEADANAGSQNITQEDLALPFLKVLGQLSPEINKQNAKFISSAEPGMIVNSVTKELYDGAKGINVIPVHYERQYVEWQDRGATSTGAPVAIHSANSDIVSTTTRDKAWKDRLPNGNYLENTANHFVILMGKTPSTALISMRSTQLKVSKQWNSIMMGLKLQGKNLINKVLPGDPMSKIQTPPLDKTPMPVRTVSNHPMKKDPQTNLTRTETALLSPTEKVIAGRA